MGHAQPLDFLDFEHWYLKNECANIPHFTRAEKKRGAIIHLHFHHKHLTAILLTAVFLNELRRGKLKLHLHSLRRLSWRRYVIPAGWLALLTPALFFIDSALLFQTQSLKEPSAWLIRFGSWIGKSDVFWTILTFAYLTFVILRHLKGLDRVFGVCLTSLATALSALPLKFSFLRARPSADLGPFSFFHLEGILEDARNFQSFPSGDTAAVAGAAGYLFFAFANRPWRWLLLLFPLASAWARVSLNRHWPSDTFFSLGLGLLAGHIFSEFKKTPAP